MKHEVTDKTISGIPTALDYPDHLLDREERGFVSRIREHGWTGTYVFCGEEALSDILSEERLQGRLLGTVPVPNTGDTE